MKPLFKPLLAFAAFVLVFLQGAILFSPSPARAAGQIAVQLNGQPVNFSDVQPAMLGNRTFVPFRAILEALGAQVTWDDATKTAKATKDGITVTIPVGQTQLDVFGHPLPMDVPTRIVNDRTMVPLRYVAQALGASVSWTPGPNGGGTVRLNNTPQEMVNQMVTGKSGDQDVSYEQAAILFEWLKVEKDKLPPFTGRNDWKDELNLNGSYAMEDPFNPGAKLFQYKLDLAGVGISSEGYKDVVARVDTGKYRLFAVNIHLHGHRDGIAIIYTVWDTMVDRYFPNGQPILDMMGMGSEVMSYHPDVEKILSQLQK